jgi:hypothetical protein
VAGVEGPTPQMEPPFWRSLEKGSVRQKGGATKPRGSLARARPMGGAGPDPAGNPARDPSLRWPSPGRRTFFLYLFLNKKGDLFF